MSRSSSGHPSANALTESELHRVLADERRRVALNVLSKRTVPMDLEELAEAMVPTDVDVEGPREEYVQRVAVALHHQHLPILTDAGAIRYEPTSTRIEAVDETSDLL